jgi:acyl-CoA thioesterase FadM
MTLFDMYKISPGARMTSPLFSTNTNVRIDDIAFGKHVCHSRIINIMHNARALFLGQHEMSEINCFGYGLVMMHLSVDYVNESFLNDVLQTTIFLNALGKASFTLDYEIENLTRKKLTAKAITTMAFVDLEKNKIRRVPEAFKQFMQKC